MVVAVMILAWASDGWGRAAYGTDGLPPERELRPMRLALYGATDPGTPPGLG
jgi:hypothetical protein